MFLCSQPCVVDGEAENDMAIVGLKLLLATEPVPSNYTKVLMSVSEQIDADLALGAMVPVYLAFNAVSRRTIAEKIREAKTETQACWLDGTYFSSSILNGLDLRATRSPEEGVPTELSGDKVRLSASPPGSFLLR